jgi:hypothetical protein
VTFVADAKASVIRDEHGAIVAIITPGYGLTAARVAAALNDCEGLSVNALEQGWVRLASELTGRLLNPTGHTDACMEMVAEASASGIQPVCGRICGALRALRSAVLGEPVRARNGRDWDTAIPTLAPDTFTSPRYAP